MTNSKYIDKIQLFCKEMIVSDKTIHLKPAQPISLKQHVIVCNSGIV